MDSIATLQSDLRRESEKAANALGEAKQLRADLKESSLRENEERNQKLLLDNLYKEGEEKLRALAWLSQMAEQQSRNIADHVKVTLTKYPHSGELVLSGPHLCAVVGLVIRNESVFNIDIVPKDVSGHFWLQGRPLAEPAALLVDETRGYPENLEPMKTAVLVLKQALRQSEAEEINRRLADADAKLWIGNLSILVSVKNPAFPIKNKGLNLTEAGDVPLSSLKCNTKRLDNQD